MATSFVEYKAYGFWAKDGFIEGLLYLLIRELKSEASQSEWLAEVLQEWTGAATVGFSGCIPVCLDEYFETEAKRQALVHALQQVVQKLHSIDDFITADELNHHKVGTGGWIGINKIGFIHTAELMLHLLEGRLKTDASSPIDYWKLE